MEKVTFGTRGQAGKTPQTMSQSDAEVTEKPNAQNSANVCVHCQLRSFVCWCEEMSKTAKGCTYCITCDRGPVITAIMSNCTVSVQQIRSYDRATWPLLCNCYAVKNNFQRLYQSNSEMLRWRLTVKNTDTVTVAFLRQTGRRTLT